MTSNMANGGEGAPPAQGSDASATAAIERVEVVHGNVIGIGGQPAGGAEVSFGNVLEIKRELIALVRSVASPAFARSPEMMAAAAAIEAELDGDAPDVTALRTALGAVVSVAAAAGKAATAGDAPRLSYFIAKVA